MSGRNNRTLKNRKPKKVTVKVPSTAERKRRGSKLLAAVGTQMLRGALQEKNVSRRTITREEQRLQRQITEQQRQNRTRRREQERIVQQQRQQEMLRQQQMMMHERRQKVAEETHGRIALDVLRGRLNDLELRQKELMKIDKDSFNADIADPIIAEIRKLKRSGADEGWGATGNITRSRESYIRAFCFKEGEALDTLRIAEAGRRAIFLELTVLLTYLPRVIYRCFGCRHDFYDSMIAELSRRADELAFQAEYTSSNINALDIVRGVEGWNEFDQILRSRTTNTPRIEKAWATFQQRIYDWINQQPWGNQFQCLPLELKLPRVSGNPDENIGVVRTAVERLRSGITRELCLVPDTNGSEGGVCRFCVDMRDSLATIDGAGVVPRGVTGQIIVGRINPDLTGTSGHLTLGEETRPLIFRFLTPEARGVDLPPNHNILIYWGDGDTLLASCPNKLSVNQLISNMVDEGYLGGVGGTRGNRNIESCEFRFYRQLTPIEKAIILQAAKALGDKFPCDIAMAISRERNLKNASRRGGVLVPSPNTRFDDEDLYRELICMGLTIDGLCFLNFTGSGQACLKAHGKTMTLSIPTECAQISS